MFKEIFVQPVTLLERFLKMLILFHQFNVYFQTSPFMYHLCNKLYIYNYI